MIYQTPLFQAKFDDIDNRELEDEIYLEKKNCSGISMSGTVRYILTKNISKS